MVLEVLEANMEESKALILKGAKRASSMETWVILRAMEIDSLKILLFVLIPIVQINRKGKCLIGT